MHYQVELKKKAVDDLKSMPRSDARRIVERFEVLADGLKGDVKRLTNHTHEYRMRSGDWRALFEVEQGKIIVYRILHRKDAYR